MEYYLALIAVPNWNLEVVYMFPSYLDGASVIMHAKIEEYGVVEYVTGEPYDTLCYYAIEKPSAFFGMLKVYFVSVWFSIIKL